MALNVVIDTNTDQTFYDSVRRLLGGVDEDVISNDDILDPAFFDMSEIDLLEMVPCLDSTEVTLSTKDLQKTRLALIYMIASRLIPKAQTNTEYEVKTIDVTWRKSPVKWLELQNQLNDTVSTLLEGIECYSNTGSDSNLFVVAPSRRAVNKR